MSALQARLRELMQLNADAKTNRLQYALDQLTQLKEVIGRRRGWRTVVMTNIENVDARRHLLELSAQVETLRSNLQPLLDDAATAQFAALFNAAGSTRLMLADRELVDGKRVDLATDLAYALSNEIGDGLRQVEIRLQLQLSQHATDLRRESLTALMQALAIGLLVIVIAILVSVSVARQLNRGITQLAGAANRYRETGELQVIEYHSRDEIGQLAHSVEGMFDRLRKVIDLAQAVNSGRFRERLEALGQQDSLAQSLNSMTERLDEISEAASRIAGDDYDVVLEVRGEDDQLARNVNKMVKALKRSLTDIQHENWLKTGQSELAAQINGDVALAPLCENVLNYLCRYLNAQVGSLFTVGDDGSAQRQASYAFVQRKDIANSYQPGEGLIGQCLRERTRYVLTSPPVDYLHIESGTGSAAPAAIVIAPLITAGRIYAVLELAFVGAVGANELAFLDSVSEQIAISLSVCKSRDTMRRLLEKTRQQANELELQLKELANSNVELQQQTAELRQSQASIERQRNELEHINDELKLQTAELERKNALVEQARTDLEVKADALARASKYKSEFLANMSHELRTPLNSLLLLAQTLLEEQNGNLQQDQVESLQVIYQSGNDLLNLINDILDLSKVEAGRMRLQMERCEIASILAPLQQMFTPLAQKKQLQFDIRVDESVPMTMETDGLRVQQVLRNLLSNAFKFTEQGEITVDVTTTSAGDVCFTVGDTGIGIPRHMQEEVFEAFRQADGSSTRRASGTGLGLTISRELARLLNGRLELESEEHRGSRFSLLLPLRAEQQLAPPDKSVAVASAPRLRAIGGGRPQQTPPTALVSTLPLFIDDDRDRISNGKPLLLIIEDEPNFARVLMEMARRKGFNCLVACTGKSGVAMARALAPQAIILDFLLPDLRGDDVMAELRSDSGTASIPIHLMSCLAADEVPREQSIGLLSKPANRDSIDNALKSILGSIAAREEPPRLLLVEDDVNMRESVVKLLRQRALMVIAVGTGREAREILSQQRIDCVILDLDLPDTDARQLLPGIQQLAHVPEVLIYTAQDLEEEDYRELRRYTDHIIIKGRYSHEKLLNDVTAFLSRLHQQEPAKPAARQAVSPAHLRGKTVLLVDDDMRNTYALGNLLRKYGMNVILADNGEVALQRLEKAATVDLALMDIMMPVMDGLEAIRRIRQMGRHDKLPIIALTAKAMPEDRQKCLEVGANDYLAKPVRIEDLVSSLGQWMGAA
jgi:signal transduction histidine kinase/DNA-binding response OmpR family regulator